MKAELITRFKSVAEDGGVTELVGAAVASGSWVARRLPGSAPVAS